jgi:chlorobactene glucosyltransferase
MLMESFMMSLYTNFVSSFFLLTLLAITNISWICLFFISIRSYLHTPSITLKRHYPIRQVFGVSNQSKVGRSKNQSDIQLPFVSVIVPSRNEQDNIERCILSLLNQDYPNLEVIVVDDDSTDNTLKIIQEIKGRIRGSGGDRPLPTDKLKIMSLTEKPDKWTGKTWASEQGYLHCVGKILLFTDADTYYMSRDAISQTLLYMLKQNLDVLTGLPLIELRDFWSKITMPLWNHFSILLGANTGAMNNPKSKVAYLVGGFFLIHKKVLEGIGTFRSVKNAIHEDAELGLLIKNAGYSIKIARIDNGVSALWSRDLHTLWHGIKRTFVPMNKWQVLASLITVFFMALLPFLLLPYNLLVAIDTSSGQLSWISDISKQGPQQQLTLLSFYLNLTSCIIIIISTAVKDMKKYRMTPTYSLLTFLGVGFIIISYIVSIISLFLKQSISWRGRTSHVTTNKV